jgi:integrase
MNEEEIRASSFEEMLAGLLHFLENEKSYSQTTLNNYRLRLRKISSYMRTRGIESYTPDVGMVYYRTYLYEHSVGKSIRTTILTAIYRLNAYCCKEDYSVKHRDAIELLPGDYEHALDVYDAECHGHGNKKQTLRNKNRFLRVFLKNCISFGCTGMRELKTLHVTRACLSIGNKYSWAVIRDFLKLMNAMGTLEMDLSTLVPHHMQHLLIPTTYSEDEISRIEKAIDRSSNMGKRAYATLLLASRLGMRSGDIVGLAIDDLDFKNSTLSFAQQKTGQILQLPMLPEIKEALEDYLRNARPETSERRVFIRKLAPYQGISTSTFRSETARYFQAAGIDTTGKKHGPRTFRSSLASSMVNDAIPYAAVTRILGHSDPNAIKHYARLNLETLRQCAIKVPEPSGEFKEFLEGGHV